MAKIIIEIEQALPGIGSISNGETTITPFITQVNAEFNEDKELMAAAVAVKLAAVYEATLDDGIKSAVKSYISESKKK